MGVYISVFVFTHYSLPVLEVTDDKKSSVRSSRTAGATSRLGSCSRLDDQNIAQLEENLQHALMVRNMKARQVPCLHFLTLSHPTLSSDPSLLI